jgi:hypothetical protein
LKIRSKWRIKFLIGIFIFEINGSLRRLQEVLGEVELGCRIVGKGGEDQAGQVGQLHFYKLMPMDYGIGLPVSTWPIWSFSTSLPVSEGSSE